MQATSLNTVIWGGRYNPIVPLDAAKSYEGLLKEFDPDLLVDLSDGTMPSYLSSEYANRTVATGDLVASDYRTGKRRIVLGFNILPILAHIHSQDIRFSPVDSSRAVIVDSSGYPEWRPFVSVVFGDFTRLPESDVAFADNYSRSLRARQLPFDPAGKPEDSADAIPPLALTGYGIRTLGGHANFSSHILYVGDHRAFNDLTGFWNIRATGRHVWFVPAEHFARHERVVKEFAERGRYPINQQVQNSADIQKSPTIDEKVFGEVSNWIAGVAGNLSRRSWQPRFGLDIDMYVGDIHAAELEAQSAEEIALLDNSRLTPIKVLTPRFLEEDKVYPGEFKWAVELDGSEPYERNDVMLFSFPHSPSVEKLVQRSFGGLPGEVRLRKNRVVLIRKHVEGSVYRIPTATKDVFYAFFKDYELEAQASQPGRYTDEIIAKLGTLHFGCRLFKIQGVRDVLARLSGGAALTKGNMYQTVSSTSEGPHGRNWIPELYEGLYLRKGQAKHTPSFTDIFDELLENQIIRPGREFTCRKCTATSWHHVSDFGEEYKCPFCFTVQRVPFGQFNEWQYKADGIFRMQHSGFGSIAVILSLWRLSDLHGIGGGRYLTSTNLRSKDGWSCEIDYAWLTTERFTSNQALVIGQATTFAQFSPDEVKKVRELSDRLGRSAYLAFSTLSGAFSSDERLLLKELRDDGHKVLAFTRWELDPYDLFDRFKDLPNKYSGSLKDLSENTFVLNIEEPHSEPPHSGEEG